MCELFCTICAIFFLINLAFGKTSISDLIFGDLKDELINMEKSKNEKEEYENKMRNFNFLPLSYIEKQSKEYQERYWEREGEYRRWRQKNS